MKKTKGECLRNNWNSINDANEEERKMRISFQNAFSGGNLKDEDFDFYIKNMWNEKVEKMLKNKK